jgi:WD40 repeat protein/serine/threonine protein kinase
MSDNDPAAAEVLGQIADELIEALRQGKHPSVEEFARRYPEQVDEIREMLPALALIEKAKSADDTPVEPDQTKGSAAVPALRQLGDYEILREVGRGGMGVVYEARQLSLGRHVAIKVLPSHALLDPRHLSRFQREARSAAKLHHTNIVPVFGVGEQDGLHYFVMQLIHGLGLDKVLDELRRLRRPRGKQAPTQIDARGRPTKITRDISAVDVARSLLSGEFRRPEPAEAPTIAPGEPPVEKDEGRQQAASDSSFVPPSLSLSPAPVRLPGQSDSSTLSESGNQYWQSVARVGMQVADALAHAASQGVLHRDIKPSNLLLDGTGNVWVTDFGLAKAASDGDNLTHTGDIVGTLRYMAPERFNGQGDLRSDVYSLGLTLYELLALRPAFDESDRNRLIKQMMHDEPVRPRKVNPAVPRDLETVVLKAIARDPAHRYQTAAEMAEDLKRFVEDRPVKARRVSEAEKLWRWCRRNPGTAVLGGALAALLVLGTAASLLAAGYFNRLRWNEAQAAQSERDARHEAEEAGNEARRRGEAERWGRYRSNIAAASAALQLQNSGAARTALEEAPEEHRNWEWHFLHSQLDGASHKLSVPGGPIKTLALSPSGRQGAVCCFDHNEAYLYDVATGRLDAVLRGHSAPATSVAYRPDGKQVATIGDDQALRLWDPATGRETAFFKAEPARSNHDRDPHVVYSSDGHRIASSAGWDSKLEKWALRGSAGTSRLWDASTGKDIAVLGSWQEGPRPVAFSHDGKRVAVGSREFVRLCDAVTGRQLAVLGPHAEAVQHLAYSPDGKRIASVTGANDIYLWDGASGKAITVMRGHSAGVTTVLFSPDGSRLVSGSQYPDNTARLWDAATGRSLFLLAGHKNEINTVAFSPDGRRVGTASSDQTARLWDARTGQLLAVLSGHKERVRHLVFSPDGTRLVTASDDATARLWDALTGELIGVLRGHGNAFNCAPVLTPDGSRLVSGSTDGTVRIWNMSIVERNGILRGHASYVYDVAFSPNGAQVASVAWDGTARLWDATTGRQTSLLKHETGIINSVAYNGDGRGLATAERERGVTLWDVASRKPARASPIAAPHFWDNRAALNPAGTLLASGCADGPVRLWDAVTGREVARLEGHDKECKDAVFHSDGRLLATTGMDGTVRLWDVARRAPVAVMRGHTDTVWRAAFSADGKLLASCSSDKTIRLWDAQTHQQLAVIPVGSIVYGVAFSPDGTRLAAGCRDNTVRLFDVATRQEVAELRGHTDYVHAVAWSPDGTRLVSGSGDFTVRVWDSLSAQERTKRTRVHAPK